MKNKDLAVFENNKIRRIWVEKEGKWYFSVIDVVGILSESLDPGAYWRKLKERLKAEGSETVTKCHTFKLQAADGKMRNFDCADTETVFRIMQSIPSPRAEPFKLWLAKAGYEKDLPDTFVKNRIVARKGGSVAGVARKQLEKQTGQSVVVKKNYLYTRQNKKLI